MTAAGPPFFSFLRSAGLVGRPFFALLPFLVDGVVRKVVDDGSSGVFVSRRSKRFDSAGND